MLVFSPAFFVYSPTLMMDIPMLGYLFRSSHTDEARRELIVLIRPTVLPTPEIAARALFCWMESRSALAWSRWARLKTVRSRQLKD